MHIQFGMPTLIECPSLNQSLALCTELSLDFVEVNMNLPEYQLPNMDINTIKKSLDKYGKYITIHIDENLNVCDFNPAVAEAYQNTVLQTIEIAKQVNIPIINMHMAEGVYFTLPDKKLYLFKQYIDVYLDKLKHFREACDKAIDESNITICIENCGAYHDFQQQGIEFLLENPHFALTYDIGHDFCAGNGNDAFILNRNNKMKHMHIHDADGKSCHQSLGEGEIDIKNKLSLAKRYGCRCVLETKTISALRKSVEWINRECIDLNEMPLVETPGISTSVSFISTNDKKVELFLSLFRGRDDVYARRWENKDGTKSGYSPVCRNEWAPGICEKPRVKCMRCKNREPIPFDKKAVTQHLAGKEIAGIYPMLPDETCLFLAIDFDDDGWQQDVAAVRSACNKKNLPLAIERSRSGNGAHIWLFFDKPVLAVSARKLGPAILTSAMEERHELKFTSYDRLFPNQDTMPMGGFGNLIALPLQRAVRDKGNSVFVDEQFIPYPDQWEFLSGVKYLTADDVDHYIATFCKNDELGSLYNSDDDENIDTPWQMKVSETKLNSVDFPSKMRIV